MQNFRKHNQRRNAPTAMDGFLRSTQPPELLPKPQFNRAYQPPREKQATTRQVDDFSKRDGFHTSKQTIAMPASAANASESMAIELPPSAAGPRFKLRKKRGRLSARNRGRNRTKLLVRTSGVMVVMALLVGGFLFAKGYFKARQIFNGDGSASAAALSEDVDPTKLNGEGDGRVNLLLLGKGGPSHEGGDLTDSLMIVSIDPVQNEASLLSVPRDLYVKVPEYGSMKINAVYSTGKSSARSDGEEDENKIEDKGIQLTEKVIEDSMGVPIHYYAMVDFDAFRKAIDTVGGIEVDVQKPVYDTNFAWQFGVLNVKAGKQQMNGTTALMYARSRYTSERGDFDRTERQREIMVALKNKVLSAGTFSNPLKISQLMSDFGDNMHTNLRLNELKRLYDIGNGIDSSKISSIGLADPPNNYLTTSYVGDQSVVIPRAGMYNYKEIQAFVRNSLKDSFIKNENAGIIVLNGAGISGLATEKSDELKSYGYNVTQVADAPSSDYSKTVLVDLTNGTKKYTKSYLEKRFSLSAINALPDPSIQATGADFVIILGQNESLSNP